jgi:hypothetical protein
MQRSKCQVDVVPHYLALTQIGNNGVQFFYQMSRLGLLHLQHLRFHCVEGFYRTKDYCDLGTGSLTLKPLYSRIDLIHTRPDLIYSRLDLIHTRPDLISSTVG